MENALSFEEQEQGHMICSKIVNFDRTAVHWCYQSQSNCTYSNVRRHATSPKFFLHTQRQTDTDKRADMDKTDFIAR